MLRTLHRAVLGFTLFAGLIAGSTAFATVPRLDDEAPEQSVSGDWRGGVVSLPIGRGYSASEIGEKLFISPKTVETYKQRISEKLGLTHRSDYVQLCLRLGLLQANS